MTIVPVPAMVEPMAPRPAVAMMMRMLRSSLALGHVAWFLAMFIGHLLSGPTGLANAAVGGAVVVFFYAAGQGIQMLASEMDPQSAMGLTVTSFVTRAALLGLLLVGANKYPAVEQVFRPVAFFTGVVLVLSGWLVGMFLAWSRTRIPVYDQHWDPRPLVRRRRSRRDHGGVTK